MDFGKGNLRNDILEWAEDGRIEPHNVEAALRTADVIPNGTAWRRFIGDLFIWLGAALIAAGIVFFLAYNWQELGRFAKFILVEALLAAAVAISWFYGLEKTVGKASLLAASLVTGALLALFGQTYQTGADPWELFAVWALLILPWVLTARLAALWLIWLALINVAATLYGMVLRGFFGWFGDHRSLLWSLFMLNTIALLIWESLALYGIDWLRPRWGARTVATVNGICASILAVWWVFEARDIGYAALPIYLLWMGTAYWFYRYRLPDLYVLAAGVLSAIVVITALLSRYLLHDSHAGGFLLIGLVIIGLSAGGAIWLKGINEEMKA